MCSKTIKNIKLKDCLCLIIFKDVLTTTHWVVRAQSAERIFLTSTLLMGALRATQVELASKPYRPNHAETMANFFIETVQNLIHSH